MHAIAILLDLDVICEGSLPTSTLLELGERWSYFLTEVALDADADPERPYVGESSVPGNTMSVVFGSFSESSIHKPARQSSIEAVVAER